MRKFKLTAAALYLGVLGGLFPILSPVVAQSTPYEQCMFNNCVGQYPGNQPAYQRCVRACANMYPPQ